MSISTLLGDGDWACQRGTDISSLVCPDPKQLLKSLRLLSGLKAAV